MKPVAQLPTTVDGVRRILIVDDNENFLELLIEGLRRNEGYQVEGAQDGNEAVTKVVSFNPHLLIVDLQLPGLDGFQVCQKVKADPATQPIKVLAISANADRATRERVLQSGADGFLKKPFYLNELQAEVRRLLGPPYG